mmetsp:Transcript_7391/g.14226  ORF Transcript_7391/g.14226 Transcript_7391/m.14226 type:complete len:426 (+) Transcript_7391:65-1342(+)
MDSAALLSAPSRPRSSRRNLVFAGAAACACALALFAVFSGATGSTGLNSSLVATRPTLRTFLAKTGYSAAQAMVPVQQQRRNVAGSAVAPELKTAPVAKDFKEPRFMWQALREAVDEEMERDPNVMIMGEDVGHYGGSYKVTTDLYKKFGEMRVLDTPICENGFTGMAIGAAMTGLRPIVEGMNMGFLLLAFNQISNNCGMLHYTSGGQYKVPIVIRGPGGVGRQLGAEHSQRLESYFQAIPGVQLVAVSTPRNAKALLKAAIRSDNPIVFFEHVLLYNLKDEVGGPDEVQSLEHAEMVREGTDVTILTYGRMRYTVMEAVKTLEAKGYNPEVIDLISLKPFDLHAIKKSVEKTHKCIIVEECMMTGGIGASLSSEIHERFFDSLDHNVVRLSSQDVPTAFALELEAATIVQPEQVVAAVEKVVG